MKRLTSIFFLLGITFLNTTQCFGQSSDYSFYIKLDSGVSVSQSADITAPSPTWNQAIQGYNSSLGTCAIAGFAVGCEVFHVMDFQVGISNRSTFEYRKYQTPVTGGQSYTRKFDLSVTPILFSATLLGQKIPYFHWDISCGTFYPIIGGAVGVSDLLITNFRTTGLAPTGNSDPYDSFSSENQYTMRKNLTYTVFAGLEYNHDNRWAIGSGYRWFDAGSFKGPRYQRVSSGSSVDVDGNSWDMQFKANEWFIEFKIFI